MNRYFEETILNGDPIDLIRLLYQRAVSSVQDAREHLREERIPQRSAAIMLAYRVVAELAASLRPDVAPDLAKQLRNLYFYIQQRLLDANMQQADQPLAEALSLLTTLQEAWSGVAASLSAKEEAVERPWSGFGEPAGGADQLAVHA